jgi:hypothetical protein
MKKEKQILVEMPPGGGRRCYLEVGEVEGRATGGARAQSMCSRLSTVCAPRSLFGWRFGSLQSETGLPPVRMY